VWGPWRVDGEGVEVLAKKRAGYGVERARAERPGPGRGARAHGKERDRPEVRVEVRRKQERAVGADIDDRERLHPRYFEPHLELGGRRRGARVAEPELRGRDRVAGHIGGLAHRDGEGRARADGERQG